jgi:hypothetical protein
MRHRFDLVAVRRGGFVCVVFAVPPTVLGRVLADGDGSSGWAPLLLFVTLSGFVLGGGVAAWHQRRGMPMAHGVITTGIVFVALQVAFLGVRATFGDSDDPIRWGRIVVALSIALAGGLVGGLLGGYLERNGLVPQARRVVDSDHGGDPEGGSGR